MLYLDWTYLLILPAIIFSLVASVMVKIRFNQFKKQLSARRITGAEAARLVLAAAGITSVPISKVAGELTDYYDPTSDSVHLSASVYDDCSVAAIGVACHECGHAIQYAEGYGPVRLRAAIRPAANIGSKLALPLVFVGLLLGALAPFFAVVAKIGVACYALCTLFELLTLPVELDASRRAMQGIENCGILTESERPAAKKVLRAAAMTYVAALATSLLQLLRLLLILRGNDRD